MEEAVRQAFRLFHSGYRPISRKHCIIARLDREDWREHMAEQHMPWSKEKGLHWVACLGEKSAESHYLLCYTKEKLTVSGDIYTNIRKLCNGQPVATRKTRLD